ncbi:hypothetical protein SERLA73DRAFT_185598 [Serpula lacrymans var. lacrymans S7.3]|uniref:Nucleolar protein 16 n=2 Tax=Serpula lacrymans var. lacrymans TaxID=341189 RepID=F8Q635_SERL3|nr:uncharacterized protein SERLADRAFT_474155 [Serpula lacrymans var. lacrymans S7.9]EGN96073.1 hypothetical protein SERLA73DRAFT_185598 [Serpula lacrymans var. lacrymans S7.3]EGO21594.1 hypothetical protein SERLADRAFT_474155 [Serpula lacrymans var. lacrymans S7.9]
MANPRQRRKTKSSSHKTISHSKRAQKLLKKMPAICGPKVLQDVWDKDKTIRQNYAAVGLAHTLNPLQAGGEECLIEYTSASSRSDAVPNVSTSSETTSKTADAPPSTPAASSITPSGIPQGFGRIIRDSTGNIIQVEVPSESNEEELLKKKRDQEIKELEAPDVDTKELAIWAAGSSKSQGKDEARGEDGHNVVKALEQLSATASTLTRYSSSGEVAYLARLATRYGGDYESMARDRRLNTEQRTAGELKRAMNKAGGVDVFIGRGPGS